MVCWLVVLCLGCLMLQVKAFCSFEMSAAGCQLTQRNFPEDLHLKHHHCENCKFGRSWAGKAIPWIWFGVDSVSVICFIMNYWMVFAPFWCLLQWFSRVTFFVSCMLAELQVWGMAMVHWCMVYLRGHFSFHDGIRKAR